MACGALREAWQAGCCAATHGRDPHARLRHNRRLVQLRDFYTTLLRAKPSRVHDDYVEFTTSRGALSFYSRSKLDPYAPGATRARSNRSVMLEFDVDDVDAEFERLRSLAIEWVKPPSTQTVGQPLDLPA